VKRIPLSDAVTRRLLRAANTALRRAYAPHSGFRVGAAALTADGRIVAGCNVENASYGLTICAERNALHAAVARGATAFRALLIVSENDTIPWPCGACRQVMREFLPPEAPILAAAARGRGAIRRRALGELLPDAFVFPPPEKT